MCDTADIGGARVVPFKVTNILRCEPHSRVTFPKEIAIKVDVPSLAGGTPFFVGKNCRSKLDLKIQIHMLMFVFFVFLLP